MNRAAIVAGLLLQSPLYALAGAALGLAACAWLIREAIRESR